MTGLPPLVLASASPRRAELLRGLELPFQIEAAQVDETRHRTGNVEELVQINARHKARAVAQKHPRALVLGADTEVCLDGLIFGKPADFAQAQRMLELLQGRWHQVVTGVCLLCRQAEREKIFAVASKVLFRQLNREQILHYLACINPFDKAGAYALQEHGHQIVAAVIGSTSNVIGLPLERLKAELEEWSRLA